MFFRDHFLLSRFCDLCGGMLLCGWLLGFIVACEVSIIAEVLSD